MYDMVGVYVYTFNSKKSRFVPGYHGDGSTTCWFYYVVLAYIKAIVCVCVCVCKREENVCRMTGEREENRGRKR